MVPLKVAEHAPHSCQSPNWQSTAASLHARRVHLRGAPVDFPWLLAPDCVAPGAEVLACP